ncbi:hypothetical protein B0H10DRAFT_2198019 [Mycena sp. CBHHK59/15]|nr:hypothetical protein B0H10DRAFT_2198019 [Mycena sp. CBHHK59/15]
MAWTSPEPSSRGASPTPSTGSASSADSSRRFSSRATSPTPSTSSADSLPSLRAPSPSESEASSVSSRAGTPQTTAETPGNPCIATLFEVMSAPTSNGAPPAPAHPAAGGSGPGGTALATQAPTPPAGNSAQHASHLRVLSHSAAQSVHAAHAAQSSSGFVNVVDNLNPHLHSNVPRTRVVPHVETPPPPRPPLRPSATFPLPYGGPSALLIIPPYFTFCEKSVSVRKVYTVRIEIIDVVVVQHLFGHVLEAAKTVLNHAKKKLVARAACALAVKAKLVLIPRRGDRRRHDEHHGDRDGRQFGRPSYGQAQWALWWPRIMFT